MVTALGVAPDRNGNGVDPLTHRKIIMGRWMTPGVTFGLDVTRRSDLRYDVAEGNAICSRDGMGADGMTEAYWPGGPTPAVAPGDPSNPRYDVIWISAHDVTQGDTDNQVTLNVTSGTPAASPAMPSLPAGAVILGVRLLAAGATSTQNSAAYDSQHYAIPYGATMGRLGYAENTLTIEQNHDDTWYVQCSASTSYMAQDRLVDVVWTGRASADGDAIGSYYLKVQIDGVDKTDGLDEVLVNRIWSRSRVTWTLKLPAGSHTVTILAKCNTNEAKWWWRGVRNVTVWDRAMA
ncbi:hypothetical protein [Bifidobacterium vansinderenii]|uniref:Uncharacterized protein n=1 Tax=Bifidobacterium vansinderenii TaxID=1984871 RepID=A0A229W1C4_9BIFI|nr:hypothetical protein [Bifidobacterium vansinderenii]OXN01662.1 hypothetical protein Tam10B_0104 [Bifidobacterium vansinderenii]